MRKSWKWLFIGRLVIVLAFTPEVRAAEFTASEQPHPSAATAITQQTQGQSPAEASCQVRAQAETPSTRWGATSKANP